MKTALTATINLFEIIFSDEQKELIETILNEINTNREKYSTSLLWEMDKEIGGIGGYCMPCDPKKNPVPSGEYRKLFRPLQYARSEIEVTNVHYHSRYVVMNSGMHLEEVCRIALSKYRILGNMRFFNTTLGKATQYLSKEKEIPEYIIDGLFNFVKIYNKAKHDVNLDDNRERLFMPSDAIVGYLAARIIGYELLKIVDHDSTNYEYSIDITKFVF